VALRPASPRAGLDSLHLPGRHLAEPGPIAGYEAEAASLIAPYDALAPEAVLGPVLDLLPRRPCRILDVGAGTGRDAAWLAERGHEVVAAEPVAAFRAAAAALHPHPGLGFVDDRLPDLERLVGSGARFEFVLLVGVWQHLRPGEHAAALGALAKLTMPGGRLLLSLRHGPGAAGRACFPTAPERVVSLAAPKGLELVARRAAPSLQPVNRAAGVTWTWLCFDKGADPSGRRRG